MSESTAATAIGRVSTVMVPVADQDQAIALVRPREGEATGIETRIGLEPPPDRRNELSAAAGPIDGGGGGGGSQSVAPKQAVERSPDLAIDLLLVAVGHL